MCVANFCIVTIIFLWLGLETIRIGRSMDKRMCNVKCVKTGELHQKFRFLKRAYVLQILGYMLCSIPVLIFCWLFVTDSLYI